MELRKVTAADRQETKKGAMRRLRASGKIPAIAYGKKLAPRSLSVSPKDLEDILGSERGRNTVIELDVQGVGNEKGADKLTVLLSSYQYHPVGRQLLHADFLQIDLEDQVRVEVPFELTGRAHGVVMGGTLRQVFRKLPVRCLPKHIPVKITHDVTALDIEQHVHVEDLVLPEGVTIELAPKRTVAGVVTEKHRGKEEEEAAPGAPAADDKDKAKPAAEKK
ncbi:MAG TPA: 50S ribosomal protein L25 [Polyangiaceae bacterium]|nr:50S ribosomal protein L25 [Polyangiaceae bacterium]